MPLYPVKGVITSTITSTYNKVNVQWKIPQFFGVTEYADDIWESPSFFFLNAEWCLRIILKVNDRPTSHKSLNLVVRNPYLCYSVTSVFRIECVPHPLEFGPVTSNFDRKNPSHGPKKYFTKENLVYKSLDDPLWVYCDVTRSSLKACQKTVLNGPTTVCQNLQDLLLSGRKSDLTIAVRGHEFKAHKIILEARSPVFAAMFEHDMTEKKESVVEVEDCDPDTFQNFLQGVYAGRIENLSVVKAIPLYMVSHKYTVTDIMDECVQLMESEMSEDTVCDILTLASRYNEADLKASAQAYMAQNMNKIFSTNNWNTLLTENSLLQKYL